MENNTIEMKSVNYYIIGGSIEDCDYKIYLKENNKFTSSSEDKHDAKIFYTHEDAEEYLNINKQIICQNYKEKLASRLNFNNVTTHSDSTWTILTYFIYGINVIYNINNRIEFRESLADFTGLKIFNTKDEALAVLNSDEYKEKLKHAFDEWWAGQHDVHPIIMRVEKMFSDSRYTVDSLLEYCQKLKDDGKGQYTLGNICIPDEFYNMRDQIINTDYLNEHTTDTVWYDDDAKMVIFEKYDN